VRPNPLNPRVELPHLYIVDREGYILKDLVFGPETEEVFPAAQGLFKELDRILAPASSRRPPK